MDFDITNQLLIICSSYIKYRRKKWECIGEYFIHLQTSRKPVMALEGNFCMIFSVSLVYPCNCLCSSSVIKLNLYYSLDMQTFVWHVSDLEWSYTRRCFIAISF